MSHALYVWVKDYTYDSRIWCVSQELYMWVRKYKHESQKMYVSHELRMMYNSRKDVREALPQRSYSVAYTPRTTYMSAESYVWVTDYTYECRIISTWVTHHMYESRMMYTSHELSSRLMWVTD